MLTHLSAVSSWLATAPGADLREAARRCYEVADAQRPHPAASSGDWRWRLAAIYECLGHACTCHAAGHLYLARYALVSSYISGVKLGYGQ